MEYVGDIIGGRWGYEYSLVKRLAWTFGGNFGMQYCGGILVAGTIIVKSIDSS